MAGRGPRQQPPAKVDAAKLFIDLPPSTGFRRLEGILAYFPKSGKVRLTVTPREPMPENLGPTLQHRRVIAWKHGSVRDLFRKLLQHELEVLRRCILEGAWPERDVFLRLCNSGGVPDEVFMERTCASCKFPPCALVT